MTGGLCLEDKNGMSVHVWTESSRKFAPGMLLQIFIRNAHEKHTGLPACSRQGPYGTAKNTQVRLA